MPILRSLHVRDRLASATTPVKAQDLRAAGPRRPQTQADRTVDANGSAPLRFERVKLEIGGAVRSLSLFGVIRGSERIEVSGLAGITDLPLNGRNFTSLNCPRAGITP